MSEQPDVVDLADVPIRVSTNQPTGVAAIIMSSVNRDEILPGESVPEAMARLRRAVVIREDSAST